MVQMALSLNHNFESLGWNRASSKPSLFLLPHPGMEVQGLARIGCLEILGMGQRNPINMINHQFGMVETVETLWKLGCFFPPINWWFWSHPQDVRTNVTIIGVGKSRNGADSYTYSYIWWLPPLTSAGTTRNPPFPHEIFTTNWSPSCYKPYQTLWSFP